MTYVVAHLSDIHFGGEHQAAVAGAARLIAETPPDLVAISGDLTQFGHAREFASAKAWVETLAPPVVVAPGNHDSPYFAVAQRIFTPFGRYRRAFGPTDGAAVMNDALALVTVNTARGAQPRLNWSKGVIAPRQVDRAIERLRSAAPGALKVVMCHHPLMEMIGAPMTGEVIGGEAACAAFSAGGVDLILSGHVHAPFALPAPCGDKRTWAVGAGTLSVRERGVPPGFNLIEIDPGCVTVKAMAWKGSHFEVSRTWALDRRG